MAPQHRRPGIRWPENLNDIPRPIQVILTALKRPVGEWQPREDRGGGLCHIWSRPWGRRGDLSTEWLLRTARTGHFTVYRCDHREIDVWLGPQPLVPQMTGFNWPSTASLISWWHQTFRGCDQFLQLLLVRLLSDSPLSKERLGRLAWKWWIDRPLIHAEGSAVDWYQLVSEDLFASLPLRNRVLVGSHITAALREAVGDPPPDLPETDPILLSSEYPPLVPEEAPIDTF